MHSVKKLENSIYYIEDKWVELELLIKHIKYILVGIRTYWLNNTICANGIEAVEHKKTLYGMSKASTPV